MKIIQLTDLHVDLEGENTFGIDIRSNFIDLLQEVVRLSPDHLVISGDLCLKDGVESIYQWIKSQLEILDIPYDIIPGNHDDIKILSEVFGIQHLVNDEELYFAKKLGKTHCLFLDSSKGFHSDRQLKWLRRQLQQADDELVIFMHHPPMEAGVPFMDIKYPLQDMEAIQAILFDHPHRIAVFCGHYHVEKSLQLRNVNVFITPSSFFQIDQESADFKVDHHSIALRRIEVVGLQLQTSVRYLRGNKRRI